MTESLALFHDLQKHLEGLVANVTCLHGEITVEIADHQSHNFFHILRDHPDFKFNSLMDVCGVDYLEYGLAEWSTQSATSTGFDRAVSRQEKIREIPWDKPRFAVVYHLLSLVHNHRVRVRVFAHEKESTLQVASLVDLWPSAMWFEREAFDLFGIHFIGHPDLRRILTDYGFEGHPFRKDFPLSGHVEVRYDAEQKKVIYEPVDIEPRILVPKVIRKDSRYLNTEELKRES